MLECLVIVDMQDYFIGEIGIINGNRIDTRRGYLVAQIIKHIKIAKKKGIPIICLEYVDMNYYDDCIAATWTCKEIRDELKYYKKAYYALKDIDNGSVAVIDVLTGVQPRRGLARKGKRLHKWIKGNQKVSFTVCGVNLHACVHDTVESLKNKGHTVCIIPEATRNVWNDDCIDMKTVHREFWINRRPVKETFDFLSLVMS